ncbi:MAG: hypothetical protein ACK5SJ_18885 [Bacteroidota bacterium]|jgi:hypothetical protein
MTNENETTDDLMIDEILKHMKEFSFQYELFKESNDIFSRHIRVETLRRLITTMLVDELIFEVSPQTLIYGLTKKAVSIKNKGGLIEFKKQEQAELEKQMRKEHEQERKIEEDRKLEKRYKYIAIFTSIGLLYFAGLSYNQGEKRDEGQQEIVRLKLDSIKSSTKISGLESLIKTEVHKNEVLNKSLDSLLNNLKVDKKVKKK